MCGEQHWQCYIHTNIVRKQPAILSIPFYPQYQSYLRRYSYILLHKSCDSPSCDNKSPMFGACARSVKVISLLFRLVDMLYDIVRANHFQGLIVPAKGVVS